jgi:hypothetical protein
MLIIGTQERDLMKALSLLWSLWISVLVLGMASAQGTPGPAVQLSFETSAVVASGLTPGKSVLWFGVEYGVDAEFSTEIRQHDVVGTAGADGTARLDLDHPLAPRSIWTAVDLDSGGYAVSGANGYRILKPPSASRLLAGGGAKADELVDPRQYLIGLAVRPGMGAWSFAGGDGGLRDMDGAADGHLTFAVDQFDPLAGSPVAPATVAANDLWFVIDPYTMEISISVGGVAQ